MVKIPCCHCRGQGFDPRSGNGGVKKKKKEFGDQLNMGKKYMGEKKINPYIYSFIGHIEVGKFNENDEFHIENVSFMGLHCIHMTKRKLTMKTNKRLNTKTATGQYLTTKIQPTTSATAGPRNQTTTFTVIGSEHSGLT